MTSTGSLISADIRPQDHLPLIKPECQEEKIRLRDQRFFTQGVISAKISRVRRGERWGLKTNKINSPDRTIMKGYQKKKKPKKNKTIFTPKKAGRNLNVPKVNKGSRPRALGGHQ